MTGPSVAFWSAVQASGRAWRPTRSTGFRAALAHDIYSAHQCVEHDNANVLCLGAQIVGSALMLELINAFLLAAFEPTEHFRRRVAKLEALEQ